MELLARFTEHLAQLIPTDSAASGPLTLALAVTVGLILGAVRIGGIRLGVSAVLFSALAFAQMGLTVQPQVLAFVRDFSLILFVYAIGLQVGPGFIASFRAEGLRLNMLALAVVVLGALATAAVIVVAGLRAESASGLYAGAYTTTPGLAAGQEALRQMTKTTPARTAAAMASTGLAYAVTYPLGVVGPIFVIVILQRLFRVRIKDELALLAATEKARRPPTETMDIEVTQPDHVGKTLREHPLLREPGLMLSRLYRGEKLTVPTADTVIQLGDLYRGVGQRAQLERLVAALGRPSAIDLGKVGGNIERLTVVVTRPDVLRRTLRELDLIRRTGVTIARINRAGVDLIAEATLSLKFGDHITVIGPAEGLKMVEAELGNCPDTLNRPRLLPIFLGVVIGVIIGAIPIKLPGLHVPLQIGLAGGPMLAAIALSQLGNLGSVVWYMPVAANQLFRDFGLAVFLACVGFESGGHFLQRVANGGAVFILWGAAITIVPLFIVGCVARGVYRMNFITLSGWIAGAMTSSPALLFANELAGSDAPAVAYAAVAPLCILSPIICAQILAIGLMR